MDRSSPAPAQAEGLIAELKGGGVPYQIVVAGGKGGVGRTTIAANLAAVLADSGEDVTYLDCDVEEPNGHLLLHPVIESIHSVTRSVAAVDQDACTLCGKCSEICRFGAIACLEDRVVTFPDLCNGCGGCTLVCPSGAIHDEPKEIGVVEEGTAGALHFVQGKLNVGCPMASVLIREAKRHLGRAGVHIVDASAGVSGAATWAMSGADYVLLVAEPTTFGLNDLRLSVDLLTASGLTFGVIINRADVGATEIVQYCDSEGIEVLLVIPDDRCVAEACAHGMLASRVIESYAYSMMGLFRSTDRRLVR